MFKRLTVMIRVAVIGVGLAYAALLSSAGAQPTEAIAVPQPQPQTTPVDPAGPEEAKPGERNLFAVIREGGLVMIPLFACSFITLVFVFERAISLRRARVIPSPFVKKFFHQLREGKLDRDQALALCQDSSSAVADVFAAAVRKWGRPAVEVEQAILDAEERAATGLRRYLRLFNGVATLGPLLGLLGTVFGMIRIFHDIAVSNAMGRTELLAGGISEAMLTTATGLCLAIPALCFYLFFIGRVERLILDIDSAAQDLVGEISSEALHEDRQAKLARASRRGTAA